MRAFLIAMVLGVALVSGAAEAADITEGPGEQCQLRLSGVIAEGDLDKLVARKNAFPERVGGGTEGNVLCVSGPGGNLAEAMRIAGFLYENGIGTRIEPGQTCLSACSVLFMLGTVYWPEGVGDGRHASRHMHVTSKLGFHRPDLKLDTDGNYTSAVVEQSFDIAILATLEFVRLANLQSERETMVPSDLIEAMFDRVGEDFYYIDTVGKTGRWDIRLDGFEPPKVMGPEAAQTACFNMNIWQARYEATTESYPPSANAAALGSGVTLVDVQDEGAVFRVIGPPKTEGSTLECLVQLSGGNRWNGVRACGWIPYEGLTISENACRSDLYAPLEYTGPEQLGVWEFDARVVMHPATPLAEANAAARRVEERGRAFLEGRAPERLMNTLQARCDVLDGPVAVTNVENFVNMRAKASFKSDVLAEVARGAVLVPADNGIYLPEEASDMDAQCAELCRSSGQRQMSDAEWQGLQQCFDANRIWYKVKQPKGEIGFVSGKFLRY